MATDATDAVAARLFSPFLAPPMNHTSASGPHAPIRRRSVWPRLLIWFTLALLASGASAAPDLVRVGVLAFFGKTETLRQWQPTGQALEQALQGARVQILPMDYIELNEAVASKSLEFVFTNPEHFVVLRKAYGLTALATLNARVAGKVVDRFGSVIFSRAGTDLIRNLEDVRGKRVAAVGLYSLGGYLLAADMFRSVDIDLRSDDIAQLTFTGLPHPQVVERVLAGQADVGIVRTGVLEEMARQGRLDLAGIRVLNARPESAFPQRLSSELSPEWPWATLAQTDPTIVKTVTATLMNMQASHPAAVAGHFEGFSPPASYTPIEDMMRRLRVFPRLGGSPILIDELWYEYDGEIVMTLALLTLGGLGLSIYLIHSNRRLRRLSRLYFEAKAGLQTTAAAFDSQIGLIITDQRTCILRANQAFSTIFGYGEAELQGQTTAFLRGGSLPQGLLGATWQQLQRDGRWSGELICTHRDGTEVPCMVSITAIQDKDAGLEGFVGSFVDMSQHHRDQAAIRQLAFYDVLTGLPNRRMFLEQLDGAVRAARRHGRHGALLFIDLDHFKTLNDAHGHGLGDQLLTQVAQRLRLAVEGQGLVARIGGDEFVVLLERLDPAADPAGRQALDMAWGLRDTLLQPCQLSALMDRDGSGGTLQHRCSASIGVALFGTDDISTAEIMKRADIAMYQAKQAGRDTIRSYDPKIQQELTERAALAADLGRALGAHQLLTHYQVQVDRTGRAVGAECLLRWRHARHGLVQPTRFIPIAEETGTIVAIGDWVIEQTCATLARWAEIPALAHLELSVNVSPRQFIEADFVDKLKATLRRSAARPRYLMLEITEGIVMDRADAVAERMHELCKLGVNLSIDDFGTGYSSLSYLQRLPLRQLKIDRSFIHDLDVNQNSAAIVRAIIALGASLDLMVVAEGVETEAQQRQLINLGSDMLQGYHVGEPIVLADFEKIILNDNKQGSDTVMPQ